MKIKKIKPLFNKIVTTCDIYKSDVKQGGIIVAVKGTIKEYQTVEAVGSTVRDIKVGDVVFINPKRYIVQQHKEKKEKSIQGVVGDNMTLGVEFPIVEYDDKKHLLIYDQDVDYIVEVEPESTLVLPEEKKIMV